MRPNLKMWLALFVIIASILACSTQPTQPPVPAATELPIQTEVPVQPTEVPAPYYLNLSLTSPSHDETSQDPEYAITARIPTLTGSDDARMKAFNTLATSIVQQAIDEFKNNIASLSPLPDIGGSSSFDVTFTQLSTLPGFVSIKFEIMGYIKGAAHPYHFTRTLNFDLEAGQEIGLDSLFQPGATYLETISSYCIAQLQTRDIGFSDMFTSGADPTPENYHNWNITPDGLLITFDEYQVAPYAAGPQTVTIPYAELSALIAPQGPLADYLP
jgi:hypothetical protein